MKQFLFFILICFHFLANSHAQTVEEIIRQAILPKTRVDITLPIPGGVYQRNSSNQANITVAGTFNSQRWISGGFYKLSLRLTPLDLYGIVDATKQVYQTELTVPLDNKGSFYHKFTNINAGWYELRIAPFAISENREHGSTHFNVGVGEVFIIGGQSNAQGLPNNSDFNYPNEVHVAAPDPVQDAVRVQPNRFIEAQFLGAENTNSPLYTNESYRSASFNFPVRRPVLSYLKSGREAKDNPNSGISPLGNSLWFWASLGEKLAERYKVPIAFFNASWGGTTITQWAESTVPNARPLGHPNAKDGQGNPDRYQPGAPYGVLRNTLKFYASVYGVRAILWQQGETDTEALISSWEGRKVASQADYRDKLIRIINQSRIDVSSNVAWVIARTSKHHTFTSDLVKNAQNAAIQSASALYYGPETDNIDVSRRSFIGDLTHFSRSGLADLAQAWFNSIDQSGILKPGGPNPITPNGLNTEPKTVLFNSDGTTSAPTGGTQYMWVYDNGTADLNSPICYDQSIPTNCSGTRRAIILNSQGNYILTQAISFPYNVVNDIEGSNGSAPLANGCYTIKAKHSNKFLQVADGNSGTRIRQQDGNGSTNQIFKLEVVDGNLYRITSQLSNKVLDATAAGTSAGTTINQYDWSNSAQQKWRLEATGDGSYKLVPSYTSSLAADVEGGVTDNGAGLFLWSPHSNDNQRFYVQSTGCSGGTTTPTTPNPPTNPSGENYEGYFDGANCDNTWGWVYDRNNPNASLTLELLVNGAVNATFTAGEFRQDLLNAGKGNGQHGFNFAPPANLKNGQPQAISLRVQGSSFLLTGSSRTITCAGNGSGPTTPTNPTNPNPPTGSLDGCYRIKSVQTNQYLEAVGGNLVEQRGSNGSNSQIWKTETPASNQYRFVTQNGSGLAMSVNALSNGEFMRLSNSANDNRQQWTLQNDGTGSYRVSSNNVTWDMRNYGNDPQLQLWGSTSESFANQRLFRFESIGCPTGSGPTTPTNPTNPSGSYEGNIDGTHCGSVWGWVYCPSNPNTSISIEILANGNVVGSMTASEFRQDLFNLGKGNGLHGFGFSLPSSVRNGQSQAISVRVAGNSYVLPGSPKTINCPAGSRLSVSTPASAELQENSFQIYPNPTDGRFTVRFRAEKGQPIQLQVVNLLGHTLLQQEFMGVGGLQEETVTLSGAATGVYLIQLQQGAKTITEKIMLRK